MNKLFDFLDIALYFILGGFFIYRGLATTLNVVAKVLFIVIGVFFIIVSIQITKQKKLYQKALYEINNNINPAKANELYSQIVKHDFLKIYTKQRSFFDLLLLCEMKDFDKVKMILDMNEKIFSSSDEMKLIKYYYLLRVAYSNNDNNGILANYKEISNLLDKGIKCDLFTRNEIDGIAYIAKNQRGDALKAFQSIDLNSLCPKDKKWILSNLIKVSIGSDKEAYQKQYNNITKGDNQDVYN